MDNYLSIKVSYELDKLGNAKVIITNSDELYHNTAQMGNFSIRELTQFIDIPSFNLDKIISDTLNPSVKKHMEYTQPDKFLYSIDGKSNDVKKVYNKIMEYLESMNSKKPIRFQYALQDESYDGPDEEML